MKSLLYICHSYHYKTRSNRFLVELLSPYFEITEFGYDPYSDTDAAYAELPSEHFDVVLCFQILPPRDVLERYISFTSGVFSPCSMPDRRRMIIAGSSIRISSSSISAGPCMNDACITD